MGRWNYQDAQIAASQESRAAALNLHKKIQARLREEDAKEVELMPFISEPERRKHGPSTTTDELLDLFGVQAMSSSNPRTLTSPTTMADGVVRLNDEYPQSAERPVHIVPVAANSPGLTCQNIPGCNSSVYPTEAVDERGSTLRQVAELPAMVDLDVSDNHEIAQARRVGRLTALDHLAYRAASVVEISPSDEKHAANVVENIIGADVLASGVIPPTPMCESEVVSRNGRDYKSSTVYVPHLRLDVGERPNASTYRSYGVPIHADMPKPYKGYYDLTTHIAKNFQRLEYETAAHYRDTEFEWAKKILAPVIRQITGQDHFYHYKVEQAVPKDWFPVGAPYPPRYAATTKMKEKDPRSVGNQMKAFGYRFYCDHRWLCGCLETCTIRREYAFEPTKAVYSIELTSGRHRLVCNHLTTYNTTQSAKEEDVAGLHPAVDMFLRQTIRANRTVTFGEIQKQLVAYLRVETGLHCSYPLAVPNLTHFLPCCRGRHHCTHTLTYEVAGANPHFGRAQSMPNAVRCNLNAKGIDGTQGWTDKECLVTPPVAVTLHQMAVLQGGSVSGTHRLEPELARQVAQATKNYKSKLYGFQTNVDLGLPDDPSVAEYTEVFEGENLYAAWERFANPQSPDQRYCIELFQCTVQSSNSAPAYI